VGAEKVFLAIAEREKRLIYVCQFRLSCFACSFFFVTSLKSQTIEMSRFTWIHQNLPQNYSKDPQTAAVLLDAVTHRNISDFKYALEVMKCDPNLLDAATGLSVFQCVLQTPNSSNFIHLCLNNGASYYKVNRNVLTETPDMMTLLTIFVLSLHSS